MTLSFRKYRLTFILILLIAIGGGIGVFTPWKSLIEQKVKAVLQEQGLQNVQLTLSDIGMRSLTIENVSWDGNNKETDQLVLSRLTLNYSIWDVFLGQFQDIQIGGLNINAKQTADVWTIAGIPIESSKEEASPSPFSMPVTKKQLEKTLPIKRAELNDCHFHIKTEGWSLSLPTRMFWRTDGKAWLSLLSKGATIKVKENDIQTGIIDSTIKLQPENKSWTGPWKVENIQISGLEETIPALSGKGTINATETALIIQGTFASEDSKVHATIELNYSFEDPEKTNLSIKETTFPWNGGTISTKDINWKVLGNTETMNLKFNIKGISLNALLGQLTGNQASGSGEISGTLPITLESDGSISVHKAKLSSDGTGRIRMSPDAIPGDNMQVALVRDILMNLNYTQLAINVENDAQNGLTAKMKVEGHNPEVSKGRPVHLNVKLTGDVLDYVQQNMTLLTNPLKYLEQNKHDNP